MPTKSIDVGIEADAIETFSRVPVDQALEELIWNSIDAEACRIEIIFHRNVLKNIERIVIQDDGHGMSYEGAQQAFGSIGGSEKRLKRRSSKLDRPYHGKEGKGRYKAFSLGRLIKWNSQALDSGELKSFSVILDRQKIKKADFETPVKCDGKTGCQVIIDKLNDQTSGLDNKSRLMNIAHRLAPVLMGNPAIRIIYDGEELNIEKAINRKQNIMVNEKGSEGEEPLEFELRILEWRKPRKATLFWCDSSGICVDETSLDMKGIRFPFSAYIISDKIRELNESDALVTGDMNAQVTRFKEIVRDKIRDYFRQRQAEEAKNVADRIRREGIYPYAQSPKSKVEKAEQQVFDICAATVHKFLPHFDAADKNSRQFTYRLLREALESSPSNLSKILNEVFKLSEDQQDQFVQILGKTSLGAIIQSAKTIANRLTFINGLEQILHSNEFRKHVKERVHLHRILAEELWLFGDEYALGSDDVSLKSVLEEHRSILKLPDLEKQSIDEIKDLKDIPDLLLWKQFIRGDGDRFEHLVIELKRPTVKISQTEIVQTKRYATKVLGNRHFDKERTHWTFFALSDEIAEDAQEEVRQKNRRTGHILNGDFHDVWALTWSQVIHDAKVRLNWIKDKLEIEVSDNSEGLNYLRDRFNQYLPDVAKAESPLQDQ